MAGESLLFTLGLSAAAFSQQLSSTIARATREAEEAAARVRAAPRGSTDRAAAEADLARARQNLGAARARAEASKATAANVAAGAAGALQFKAALDGVTNALNSSFIASKNLGRVQYAGGATKSVAALERTLERLNEARLGMQDSIEKFRDGAVGGIQDLLNGLGFKDAAKSLDALSGIGNVKSVQKDIYDEQRKTEVKLYDLKTELSIKAVNKERATKKRALEDEANFIEQEEKDRANKKGADLLELNQQTLDFSKKVYALQESEQKKLLVARIDAITKANVDTNVDTKSARMNANARLAKRGVIAEGGNPDDPLEEGFTKFTPAERRARRAQVRAGKKKARELERYEREEQKKIDDAEDRKRSPSERIAKMQEKDINQIVEAKDPSQDEFAKKVFNPELTEAAKAKKAILLEKEKSERGQLEVNRRAVTSEIISSQNQAEREAEEQVEAEYFENGNRGVTDSRSSEIYASKRKESDSRATKKYNNFYEDQNSYIANASARSSDYQNTVNAQFSKPAPAATPDNNKTDILLQEAVQTLKAINSSTQ